MDVAGQLAFSTLRPVRVGVRHTTFDGLDIRRTADGVPSPKNVQSFEISHVLYVGLRVIDVHPLRPAANNWSALILLRWFHRSHVNVWYLRSR